MAVGVSRQSKALRLFLSQRSELLGYASRITGDRTQAEDVLQEAWLRLRATEPDRWLEEPAGYLRRIVRNLALDGQRRRALEARIFAENADLETFTVSSDAPTPENAVISRGELGIVSSVLAEMPERMRIAVEMHRVEGARLKEIAAHLGCSVTTAHELVVEGVARCRTALRHAS
jgi:RNA polymerase sigma-70 factor (ECF subfamily)